MGKQSRLKALRPRQPRPTADPGRPTFRDRPPLPLSEHLPGPSLARMVNGSNDYLRVYRLGECGVIVTREFGRWHLSVSHPSRYPLWDEVAEVRYRVIPDGVTMAMPLPPSSEYINLHPNCFQLVEITEGR